jgi:hypothetical protein
VLDTFEAVGVLNPALRTRNVNASRGLVAMVSRPCPTFGAGASILQSCASDLDTYLERRSATYAVRPLRTEMIAKAIVCEFAKRPPNAMLVANDVVRAVAERLGASADEVAETVVRALGALGALVGAGLLAAEPDDGSEGCDRRLAWSGPSLAPDALIAPIERQRRPASSAAAPAESASPAARADTRPLTSVFKQVKRAKAGGASLDDAKLCGASTTANASSTARGAATDQHATPLKRASRLGGGGPSKQRLELALGNAAHIPMPPSSPACGSQPAGHGLAAVGDVDAAALAAHIPPTAGCRRALEAAFDAEGGAHALPLFFTSPLRAARALGGAPRVGAKRSLDHSQHSLDCELESFAKLLFDAPPLDGLEAFAHAVDEVGAVERRGLVAASCGPSLATPAPSARGSGEMCHRAPPPAVAARLPSHEHDAMRLIWHLGPRRSATSPPATPRQKLALFTDDPTTSAVQPRVLLALAQQGWTTETPECSERFDFYSPAEHRLADDVVWDATVARLVQLLSPSDALDFGVDFEADTQCSTCASVSMGTVAPTACDEVQVADGRTAGSESAACAPPKMSLGGEHRRARARTHTSATHVREAHAARVVALNNVLVARPRV